MISGTRYRLSVEINRQAKMAADIARLQTEISTGKRIQAPSDDPTASARISQLARAQADEAAWIANLDSAAALAERSDTALESVANRIDRAAELILSASSGTLSAENRAIAAAELNGIAQELAALADSPDPRGEPLFRTGIPLEIPVHSGGTITPVASRDVIFGNIATAAGLRDLQTIITEAATAVLEPDDTLRAAATQASIDAVNAAATHVAGARGNQGVTAHRIEDLKERMTQSGLQLEEQRTGLEATDRIAAIAKLNSSELGLQAAQAVFARVNQGTLFDLLR
jgi:flagellar hook-associated protein 3 FlgL